MPITISDDLATGILQYLQRKGPHGRALGALMSIEATAPQRDLEIAGRIKSAVSTALAEREEQEASRREEEAKALQKAAGPTAPAVGDMALLARPSLVVPPPRVGPPTPKTADDAERVAT